MKRVMTLSLQLQATAELEQKDGVTEMQVKDTRHSTIGFMTKAQDEAEPPTEEYKRAMAVALNKVALKTLLDRIDEGLAKEDTETFPQVGASA